MSKVAIVFWSGTGNTEAMASLVAEGVKSAGGEAKLVQADGMTSAIAEESDAFALGCPAMGGEELEDAEFQPMYDELKEHVGDRKVGLFGSYGWGTGEWMETWEADATEAGIDVVDTVIANGEPDDDASGACRDLGALLAG
ncbi:MAG: flavodoxin [Atopobiaceae bacterium]|jgi:flavodoxin short chain|nr:flavodoxin [Atopobiaceae bacterium]MCI2174045.1 flavodoxin [Atopobiaceae bacterium]MCI2207865.1 flavodoxin [Atopobiaceae bacterium]